MELLEPKEVEIDGRHFIISKFPAVAGREIITKYPLSSIPKLGDYAVNQETMLKLMSYVAMGIDPVRPLRLSTIELVNNHCGSWETLAKVEMAMLEYNCSFFRDGRISIFLDDIARKVPAWTSKILTALSVQSSRTEKPPSTN